MKAKVILYGWCISWFFLFVGAGAMENGETGRGKPALFSLVLFSFLLMVNEKECCKNTTGLSHGLHVCCGGSDKG